MAKVMIVTVGTGPNVAHGICFSIRDRNPEEVVFLVTEESKDKTMPIILKNRAMEDREHREIMLHDPNDVEKIAAEAEDVIKSLKHKKQDVAIDYTSGTKAMSAGVTIAGIKLKVGFLVYVTGERDERGVVISGTERPVSLQPNRIYADDLWIRAVELFNEFQYEACAEIIGEAKLFLADEEYQKKLFTLESLAEAYSCWDRFDLTKAFEKLDNITTDELLAIWGIKSRINDKNKAALYQEKENIFCKERIADLLENAKRRAAENKYDDAVARLYRTIEFIGQYKVNQRGLFKKNEEGQPKTNDLDIKKLPKEMQEKYKKYIDNKDNKIKLGLRNLYELLDDLGEEIGTSFMKEIKKRDSKFKKLLGARNNSILAHGFNYISKSIYEDMLNTVIEFARLVDQELDKSMDKVKFPTIRL